jgi:hypothetical protein
MLAVYTLIVDGAVHSITADAAPLIGDILEINPGLKVRVLRSTDGGRIYNAETVSAS